MIDRFDRVFRRWVPWQLHMVCLMQILVLGYFDYRTGFDASFSIFYLLPVSMSAWYSRGPACYFYSFLAAGVWDLSNILAGELHGHPVIYVWNGMVRAGFFLTTSVLLQRLHSLLERERQMSRRDYRTGLLNGLAFHDALRAEHSRSVRKSRPLGVAFIDLDHFKQVNDELGHDAGDRVLVAVARSLESHLRQSDVIARMGGDEFAVILPECGLDDAQRVAAKLVACVRELSKKEGWPVTASIGVVVSEVPLAEDSVAELLKASDHLMYRVKEAGRDHFLASAFRADR